MDQKSFISKRLKKIIFIASVVTLVAIFLYILNTYSYLFFHTTVEYFSTLIAFSMFLLAWNARNIIKNTYFLFLSFAFLSVGFLDFIHALSYKGMQVIYGISADEPTQLWIASRFLLAVSLFIAPLLINKKFNSFITSLVYITAVTFILLSIFHWKIFPASYVEGKGLTLFKIIGEYVISLLFLGSIFMLRRIKDKFDSRVYILLIHSLIFNIVAELIFTFYIDVYGIFNMLGHYAKLFSYYFIYKAIIEIGLTKPYRLLFLELEELNRRKDEFLSIASHEMKSPITSITLYSQLLQKRLNKKSNQENIRIVENINYQAKKIKRLINDLLDVSNIENDRITYNFNRFTIDELARQVTSDARRMSSKHKIVLTGLTKIQVTGDKERISQVLVNLINNAIKYSPDGGKITVKLKRVPDKVIVSVHDTGIGIPQGIQPYIFEKYYRTKKGKEITEGLGLGLYIAKEIIKNHKGKIWVESPPAGRQKGSIFYFTLPIEHRS